MQSGDLSGVDITQGELVETVVENIFNVNLRNRSRRRKYCVPRWIAYKMLFEVYRWEKVDIGAYFGFDHSTVINGLNRLNDDMSIYSDYRRKFDAALRKLTEIDRPQMKRMSYYHLYEAMQSLLRSRDIEMDEMMKKIMPSDDFIVNYFADHSDKIPYGDDGALWLRKLILANYENAKTESV